jgi:hypothetical protein
MDPARDVAVIGRQSIGEDVSNYSEPDLVVPTLELLAAHPGGLSTTDLIEKLTELFKPDGDDAEILSNRQDTHFSQKVRNLVSHRTMERGDLWTYGESDGIHRITPAGMSHLAAHSSERAADQ